MPIYSRSTRIIDRRSVYVEDITTDDNCSTPEKVVSEIFSHLATIEADVQYTLSFLQTVEKTDVWRPALVPGLG